MRKYLPLIILLALFVTPILAAAYVLKFADDSRFGTIQHGNLIRPAQKITDLQTTPNKWNILFSDLNDEPILTNLQKALGTNGSRVTIAHTSWNEGAMIIDPQGMYIMHYPLPINAQGLLKDLRRLLKYSHAQ